MNLRKLIFWCHLTTGCIAGVVILVMCVTGSLLASQRSVTHWAERNFRAAPAQDSQHLPGFSLTFRRLRATITRERAFVPAPTPAQRPDFARPTRVPRDINGSSFLA
jgi:uncharacterized iron-regulated membrane protein